MVGCHHFHYRRKSSKSSHPVVTKRLCGNPTTVGPSMEALTAEDGCDNFACLMEMGFPRNNSRLSTQASDYLWQSCTRILTLTRTSQTVIPLALPVEVFKP